MLSIGVAIFLCQSIHSKPLDRGAGKSIDSEPHASIQSSEARRMSARVHAGLNHSYDVLHDDLTLDLTESLAPMNHNYTAEEVITLRVDTTELESVNLLSLFILIVLTFGAVWS